MRQYLDQLKFVLDTGHARTDRTGTGTISTFGLQAKYDLSLGFPLVTTKKTHFKSIAHELLWFLKGTGDISYLRENGVTIWDEWASEAGHLGPVYGVQWRGWSSNGTFIDQLASVIEDIKSDPYSRRHVVSAWNVGELEDMALPPCHLMFQFYVTAGGFLDLQMYQRSADMFLGVPFNIASYSLLLHMVAQVTGYEAGTLTHVIGDAHIYVNHLDAVKTQLRREPKKLPTIELNRSINDIDDFTFGDFTLIDYEHHPALRGDISV